MYCPNCGENENGLIQFCRTCGANLRLVRDSLEQSDQYTALTIKAREEIARAAAEKIRTGSWWQVGAIVPEVEKLFESAQDKKIRLQRVDQERRLNFLRGGTITSFVGVGLSILFLLLSTADARFFYLIGLSAIVLLIGLAIVINGLYFSVPQVSANEKLPGKKDQQMPEGLLTEKSETTPLLFPAKSLFEHSSVTEHTTQQLSERERQKVRNTNKNL